MPPIPCETLMSLIPEKHSKFLSTHHRLSKEIDEYRQCYYDEKEERVYDCSSNRGQQQYMLQVLEKIYWQKVLELYKLQDEHYQECAQILKLGLYEPKRGSFDVSTSHCQDSAGSSVSESHGSEFTQEALEALYHTERELEGTLEGFEEEDDESLSVGGYEAEEEDSECDSETEVEWHIVMYEGLEEPSEDKADAYEGLDELSEDEVYAYKDLVESSEYEADDEYDLDEGDVDKDEGSMPSGAQECKAWDMPSTSENSLEFSTLNEYEAGITPAEIDEGLDGPSSNPQGLPYGSHNALSCNKQLVDSTDGRFRHRTSVPWTRGVHLLIDTMLSLPFGSVICRNTWMAIGHRTGVG
jgi:hypothetical protein